MSYTNDGKGKYGECPLYPGKDPNYVMVDHCYPTFKYRGMSMYLGSLYGFQDRINKYTKPQFIGRRYNVNGMNSLDPLYYQSMDDCYGNVALPFAAMKSRYFRENVGSQPANWHYENEGGDPCNVKTWKCEWDDRVFKTMPRMERQYLALAHNGAEDFGRFVQKSEDDVVLDYVEHYQMDGVKQFEDGGRCTKWKSPSHVWLEVPPDDVIVEFGGSDRPFILDQTFCLTRPLRRRLVEDNKMSNFQRAGGDGKLDQLAQWKTSEKWPWKSSGQLYHNERHRITMNFTKTGGEDDEINTLMHGVKSIERTKESATELKEKLMKAKDINSIHLKEEMQKYRLNNEHSGTFFCNSGLIEDDEDAQPVVMSEDNHEWQCTKLIHRQQWKEVVQSELDDFRLFMKYAYGSDVEEEHFHQKGGKFDDDICDKERGLTATLCNSILRRKVQKDIDAGSERQSDWDVMPELLERDGYERGWRRKVNNEVIFDKDLLINDEFKDQWEIIWQDWGANPLTKHAIDKKQKYFELRGERCAVDDLRHPRMREDFKHDEEHLKECELLDWTCQHAQWAERRWEKERTGMVISSILSNRCHNWYNEDNKVLPPNNVTAGNELSFVKEGQKEKVEAINANLVRMQVKAEESINGREAAFGRRKGVRWTTIKKQMNITDKQERGCYLTMVLSAVMLSV